MQIKWGKHFSPVSFSTSAKGHFFLVFHFQLKTKTIPAPRWRKPAGTQNT